MTDTPRTRESAHVGEGGMLSTGQLARAQGVDDREIEIPLDQLPARLTAAFDRLQQTRAADMVPRAATAIDTAAEQMRAAARLKGARRLRELAAGLSNGGIVLVRNVGTDEVTAVSIDIVDELLELAMACDGKTLEEAAAEIA